MLSSRVSLTLLRIQACQPARGELRAPMRKMKGSPLLRTLVLCAQLLFLWPARNFAQDHDKPRAPEPLPASEKQNLKVIAAQAPYSPITGKQRVQWAAAETFGPESWLVGIWTAGIGTARDKPEEYGPHWEGFSKRYAIRFSGIAASPTAST